MSKKILAIFIFIGIFVNCNASEKEALPETKIIEVYDNAILNLINQVNSLENKVKELENNKVINKQKRTKLYLQKKSIFLKVGMGD